MTNGVKEYNEGHADQSVQWIASGEAPLASSPLLLDGFLLRIFSDIPELPQWWSRQRDSFLRTRLQSNSLISGIVYGEATRIRNMPYVLTHEDDNQEELQKWQNMLQLANFGRGFPVFASKIATDYLTQDNGCFFEILGAGEIKLVNETFYRRVIENGIQREIPYTTTFLAKGERTGQATGIAYLDAGQCWRTMNPEYPIIYTNPYTGQLVVLHWTRVSYDSQFPQGYELARDVGLCALSRAYETMRQVKAINTYYYEKVTGQSAEIIYANQPVSKLDSAVQAAMFQGDNAGFQVFKNTMLLAPKSGGVGAQDLKFDKIGLRDQPDGFSYREQMDIAVNILAQAFGVDVREIWAAAQTGATKADAEVQDIKTTGKGRADILSMLENAINWRVLPPEITFKFDEVDDLSDKRKSEIKQIRVNTRATQIQSGELNLEEAREMAAEDGDIMPEFLERIATADDMTAVESVNPSSADEQPKEDAPDAEAQAQDSESDEKALRLLEKDDLSKALSCSILLNLANNADLIVAANSIKRKSNDYAWESPSDYHVTLIYIKEISPENLVSLLSEFNEMKTPDVTLHIGKTGAFNNDGESSLHFAVDADPDLMAYQAKLYKMASEYGELSEYSNPESWTPHITLAYAEDEITDTPALKKAINIKPYGAYLSASINDEYAAIHAVKEVKKNEKQYGATRSLFFSNLLTFCDLAANRQISSRNFMSSLKGEIRLAGRAAFLDGIKSGAGSFSITEEELSPDEIALRNSLIEIQVSYASNLRVFAFSDPAPSFIEIISRVSVWAKKGLDGIYASAKVMGAGNKLQEWFYGDTIKHCETCSAAKGQVHRAKTWRLHGIIPRADKLYCKGFECDCELRDTTKPVSGRITRIPLLEGKHVH